MIVLVVYVALVALGAHASGKGSFAIAVKRNQGLPRGRAASVVQSGRDPAPLVRCGPHRFVLIGPRVLLDGGACGQAKSLTL